ncbi:MAG: nuclear transport factor 2 family protein, partial [Pseudomonadota bacterium]
DMTAIQKLQATYLHSMFTQRYENIPGLFALDRADVSVEFSDSGVYRGGESVTGLYKAFEATRNAPAFFLMHLAVNPFIEIASDGQSAKSHWLSPGVSNSKRNGSSWIWGPYYVDYVKENGIWKIHHSNLVPLFRNPYEYSWNDAPAHGTVTGQLSVMPDEPITLYRPFNEVKEEADMFRNHPALPQPY